LVHPKDLFPLIINAVYYQNWYKNGYMGIRFAGGDNYLTNALALLLVTRMMKLPNKKAGDNMGKNWRGSSQVVPPALQG
jgi:hypothetical protein